MEMFTPLTAIHDWRLDIKLHLVRKVIFVNHRPFYSAATLVRSQEEAKLSMEPSDQGTHCSLPLVLGGRTKKHFMQISMYDVISTWYHSSFGSNQVDVFPLAQVAF